MNSCVNLLRLKSKDHGFNLSCFHSFFLSIILFIIFAAFFKLIFSNQFTMDEHKHKILATFCVFHGHFESKKKRKLPPSFTNKHRNSTKEKAQQEEVNKRKEVQQGKKFNKRRRSSKSGEENEEKKKDIRFGLKFTCSNIDPKGCKLTSQVERYPFYALRPSQGCKVID